MARMISFYILIAIIVVCGIFFFRVMAGFFLPLFLAAILVVMFRPVHRWISVKCKGRIRLAAALTALAILLIVLIPLAWISALAVAEGVDMVGGFNSEDAKDKLAEFRRKYDLELPAAETFHRIQDGLDLLSDSAASGGAPAEYKDYIDSLIQDVEDLEAGAHETEKSDDQEPMVDLSLTVTSHFTPLNDELKDLKDHEPGTQTYEASLERAELAFRNLQRQLFGNPFRAWLVKLANPSDKNLVKFRNQVFGWLQKWLLSVTGTGAAFVTEFLLDVAIMVVAVYYFFADGPMMIKSAMQMSPLEDRYEEELLTEFDTISRAVVLATLLTAVAQGLLAGIGYYFVGMQSVLLLTVLTMIFALIPFIGAAAVWAPVCLWLFFYEGREVPAILLAVYGAGIVSMADNVIKPMVLHGQSKLHPLLALLSVIGGVQALGPIGILVGPMVVAFLQALLNMLNSELTWISQTPQPVDEGGGTDSS